MELELLVAAHWEDLPSLIQEPERVGPELLPAVLGEDLLPRCLPLPRPGQNQELHLPNLPYLLILNHDRGTVHGGRQASRC